MLNELIIAIGSTATTKFSAWRCTFW